MRIRTSRLAAIRPPRTPARGVGGAAPAVAPAPSVASQPCLPDRLERLSPARLADLRIPGHRRETGVPERLRGEARVADAVLEEGAQGWRHGPRPRGASPSWSDAGVSGSGST